MDEGVVTMRNSTAQRSVLVLAGLVLVAIGSGTLFVPVSFHSANGIDLGGSASLLSETRAAGGVLLAIGVLVMLGAFLARLSFAAAAIGALVYLAYGLARLLSLALDGRPAGILVLATVLELLLGIACALALVRHRGDNTGARPH